MTVFFALAFLTLAKFSILLLLSWVSPFLFGSFLRAFKAVFVPIPMAFFSSWTANMCVFMLLFWENLLSHIPHLNRFSLSWTVDICRFRVLFSVKYRLQISQPKGFSSSWTVLCDHKSHFKAKSMPQTLHWKHFFFSWTSATCTSKTLFLLTCFFLLSAMTLFALTLFVLAFSTLVLFDFLLSALALSALALSGNFSSVTLNSDSLLVTLFGKVSLLQICCGNLCSDDLCVFKLAFVWKQPSQMSHL